MFGPATADNYCDRCGRDCNCTTVDVIITIDPAPARAAFRRIGQRMKSLERLHGMALSCKPFLDEVSEDPHWREAAWHPWGPIPVVHLDQGVPSPRWREYQRRP